MVGRCGGCSVSRVRGVVSEPKVGVVAHDIWSERDEPAMCEQGRLARACSERVVEPAACTTLCVVGARM